MSKFMTWNIMHGGGAKRLPAIILDLIEHDADVIVLTEYRTTTGGQLRGILADHGWEHQACGDPGPRRNGVLIASRTPVRVCGATDRLLLEVELPELEPRLVGLHIPCGSGSTARNCLWKGVLRAARACADGDCVLLGDFNTGRHRLDETGATFRQTANLGRLSALGYVDAWRAVNPNKRDASWLSRGGNGFRIDHAFVSRPLAGRIRGAWYSHRGRRAGLSDHASLVFSLAEREACEGCSGAAGGAETAFLEGFGRETQKTLFFSADSDR